MTFNLAPVRLYVEVDRSILACYSWDNINLEHGFYQNEQGQVRFTISPKARREILYRLLELNLTIAEKVKNFVVGVSKYGQKRN